MLRARAFRASDTFQRKGSGHAASRIDHGSRRARLPQLQHRVIARTPGTKVVAFTATQIPFIDDRRYPPSLAGRALPGRHPDPRRVRARAPDPGARGRRRRVQLLGRQARVRDAQGVDVLAAGANFVLLGPDATMLQRDGPDRRRHRGANRASGSRRPPARSRAPSRRPASVSSPSATRCRTGTSRRSAVQRYAELADLDRYNCTIEEREEYEPHITSGTVIYAGVDYGAILEQAQAECDVLLWDGGNNDLPFYRPTSGSRWSTRSARDTSSRYHPGETNLRGGRRRRDQQDGLRDAGAGRAARGDDRGGEPRRRRGRRRTRRSPATTPTRSRASASSWSRTGRRSPTAR